MLRVNQTTLNSNTLSKYLRLLGQMILHAPCPNSISHSKDSTLNLPRNALKIIRKCATTTARFLRSILEITNSRSTIVCREWKANSKVKTILLTLLKEKLSAKTHVWINFSDRGWTDSSCADAWTSGWKTTKWKDKRIELLLSLETRCTVAKCLSFSVSGEMSLTSGSSQSLTLTWSNLKFKRKQQNSMLLRAKLMR